MARTSAKTETVQDFKADLIENLIEFARLKNIDRASLMNVLEEVFRAMIRRKYETDDNVQVIVNPDKGDIQAFRERLIVNDNELEDINTQIPLSEALRIDEDYEEGDELAEEIDFNDFGRRHVMAAKQMLAQRIKELEKNLVFNHYKEIIGEIVVGEVYQIWRSEILVQHEGNELHLPKTHQIPKDRFKKGDTVRAVIHDVEMRNTSPRVIISRTSPVFLERLFELEVPEIFDGLINIKGIVREPGERAKVAVESYDDRIDPVGACVGMRGSRIHGIVRELRNENIDVINYTNNTNLYIQRALSPAKVHSIHLKEDDKRASVYLMPDQVSLAIGRGGLNVKLAGRLTGYEIDIFRQDTIGTVEEDVDLDEFTDEIEDWIIVKLKDIGCDTAKQVLALTAEEIARRADLEEEQVAEVLAVLRKEFEEEA